MFDRSAAEKLGWTLTIDTEDGHAENADGRRFAVTSSIPLFSLLVHIADLEGQALAQGYGGDQPVTPDLVQQVSGETYAPDPLPPPPAPVPPDPPVSASLAVHTAVTAAMATVSITSPNLTAQQKQQIQDQVTLAVQAVVDKAGLA